MGTSGSKPPPDPLLIGVFGGTFDPVHNGHLRIALDAREALGITQVRLIPLAQAVHRDQPETPAALRLAMLQAALAGRKDLVADDRELRRTGPSYTIDTLKSLQRDYPDASLCLLLGADAFAAFTRWRNPEGIMAAANIAVLERPGQTLTFDHDLERLIEVRRVDQLEPRRSGQVLFCPVTQLDIASSDIRRRIAAGHSADFLTPPAVVDFIARHGLYHR
jgi:nicotinate-nucleotide adenylyltransferase